MYLRVSLIVLSLTLSACGDNNNNNKKEADNPYIGYTSELYDGQQNWLCRPDVEGEANICNRDLSITTVFADGSTQVEEVPAVTATDEPIDCFYVYPTVSGDTTDNADLQAGAEIGVTFSQAARYRGVCSIYAPLYRQVTVAALFAGKFDDPDAFGIAYGDVLDAFKQFVANSSGRGFILIGHSQGTSHLIRLIQEEIEADPYLASRMIAAHLMGISVALPNDAEIGATFASTPPCTFDDDISCFVNYVSFRETAPPIPGQALFGVTASDETRAACTHPVDLGAGRLALDSIFSFSQLPPYTDPALNRTITTPFVKVPGLFEGECIEEDGKGYLAITINGDPSDPRVDDVNDFLPGWGLHLIDSPLPQGDMLRLAQKQADAWLNQ